MAPTPKDSATEGGSRNLGVNIHPGNSEAGSHWAALGGSLLYVTWLVALNLEWKKLTDPVLGAGEGICVGTDLSEALTRLNFQSCSLES